MIKSKCFFFVFFFSSVGFSAILAHSLAKPLSVPQGYDGPSDSQF